ncbi:DNA-binding protein [Candidatus Neomarinimicrobiota bacterium]
MKSIKQIFNIKSTISIILAVISLSTLTLGNDNYIKSDEARKYVGQNKTVCGTVEGAYYSYRSNGKPTFINIDKPYPNNEFMIVIWGSDRYKFNPIPEVKYKNKDICITGKIKMYKGKAEIIVTDPAQIVIQNKDK